MRKNKSVRHGRIPIKTVPPVTKQFLRRQSTLPIICIKFTGPIIHSTYKNHVASYHTIIKLVKITSRCLGDRSVVATINSRSHMCD
mgnify:CR=1 FL=1